jgi:hypothetical protein
LAEGEEDGLAQAVLRLDERAEAVGEFFRQHRDDGADEIGGVAAALRLAVERRAGLSRRWRRRRCGCRRGRRRRRAGLDRERVVEILRVVGIDREHGIFAVVEAVPRVSRLHGGRGGGGLALDVGGKIRSEIVLEKMPSNSARGSCVRPSRSVIVAVSPDDDKGGAACSELNYASDGVIGLWALAARLSIGHFLVGPAFSGSTSFTLAQLSAIGEWITLKSQEGVLGLDKRRVLSEDTRPPHEDSPRGE